MSATGRAAALLASGAVACLMSSSMSWATVGQMAGLVLQGLDAAPALRPMAALFLAGSGAVLAARGLLRRVIGALCAIAAMGTLIGVATALRDGLRAALAALPAGIDGSGPTSVAITWGGPLVAGSGLVLAAAGGVMAAAAAAPAPSLGARFDAPSRSGEQSTTDVWAALDRGEDPTAGEA